MVAKKKVKKTKEIKKSKFNCDLANFNFIKPQNKSQLVLKNLIVFVGLFIFSWIGSNISTNEIFINFFKIIRVVSIGFILGLVITLLILLILKIKRK